MYEVMEEKMPTIEVLEKKALETKKSLNDLSETIDKFLESYKNENKQLEEDLYFELLDLLSITDSLVCDFSRYVHR